MGFIFVANTMQNFSLYFNLGIQHISSLDGNDHILFLLALCVRYMIKDWQKLLVLVTAFTIGHSITLALSVLNIINISTKLIEFLIPITIILTAISNLRVKQFNYKSKFPFIYFLALFFGLIHGLGFSNYLKSLLGKNESVIQELFAFNMGLEVGQLLIVMALMLVSYIFVGMAKINRREWIVFVSGGAAIGAFFMALNRIPF